MSRLRTFLWLLVLALTASAGRLWAQAQTDAVPQPLAETKSPVDRFRELLAMTPDQRLQALANMTNCPSEYQQRLLAKLREYQALTPEVQALRLQATELRWWLLPLMREPATNRAALLKAVPARLRSLVDEKLALWNLFPPQLQQQWLRTEETARFWALTAVQQRESFRTLPAERRAELEAGLARWRAMSEEQRRTTCEQFERFFTLPEREQEKILGTFSAAERQQMEQTCASFEKLPPDQRQACVRSFKKFANLSPAEREQFLKNAARWQQMTPAEREAWRTLVNDANYWPPMPPGLDHSPPLPPLPFASGTLETNGR